MALGMPEREKARAALYRREAAELRKAADLIKDPLFREQLIAIAREYEAVANEIERGGDEGVPHREPPPLSLGEP